MRQTTSTGFALSFLLAMGACSGTDKGETGGSTDDTTPTDTTVESTPDWVDNDDDGVTVGDGDCDDEDPTVYPGRVEECNAKDDNCNSLIDESFGDADEDGTADCLDSEDCDGLDNDGDGTADEDFADVDEDGVADCLGTESCDGVDNDGDGQIDEGYDADADGYSQCGTVTGGGTSEDLVDCDDADASVNPGAAEADGDGKDNNCDGAIDSGTWASGDLIITEVMNNPGLVVDTYGEWVEVYNATDRDLTLNGLVILSSDGAQRHKVAPEGDEILTVGAHEYFIFGIEDDTTLNGSVGVGYQYSDITLSNESDDLALMMGEVLVDEMSWDNGGTMPDPDGATLTLDPSYISAVLNDDGSNWCSATIPWGTTTDDGSPSGDNEVCTTVDHDGDGYSTATDDCDDTDDTIYPGAPEIDPAVDNDCDGVVEWMPTADPSYDTSKSTLFTCDALYLVGSASYDSGDDASALTYSWELTSAPAGSILTTADIVNPTDESPTFIPDVEGDYTFSLTVTDAGDAASYPVAMTVSITTRTTNIDPVANAGSDLSYADSVACQAISYGVYYDCAACTGYTFTLDASGSTDADDDEMSYVWEVTSGSYYTLADETTVSASLTVSGVEPTYGETSTVTIETLVTATDCMGATSTDTMTVTYTCTGT